MYIDDFVWLPDVLERLAVKHDVTQDEVEEVFFDLPRYRFVESGIAQANMCTQLAVRLMQVGT